MNLYLPIAEISVNVVVLIGMGAAVGFLSGLFGVGGGFLITPLLIFYNIPPAVAVATGANQVIASSFSGALAHYKRGTVDLKLGTVLLIGGTVGSASASPCSRRCGGSASSISSSRSSTSSFSAASAG